MGWTPPTKATVIITFLLMGFGIFLLLDISSWLWVGFLPYFPIGPENGWHVIAVIVLFLSWFLFFLGVIFKGI